MHLVGFVKKEICYDALSHERKKRSQLTFHPRSAFMAQRALSLEESSVLGC